MTVLFAAAGGFFASHWNVVLSIGVLFFMLQMGLCTSFYLRMRRREQTLLRLYRDLQGGGEGRTAIEVYSARFPWLKWVRQIFPAGTTTPGNYTRDDVLQELDTRISSSSDYLFLQRMGVMAPLLGVILTVMGFWWLDVPESGEQSLNDILFAVTPLVAGVGTGAVLAFINQGLLHLANVKSESLRMVARTWFDGAIWSAVGLDTQAATVKAVAGIEKMALTVSESADKQRESTQWLADSTLAIQEAATEFCTVVQQFGGGVQELPETLGGLQAAMESSVQTIQSLVPVAERVVAGLDVSVSAFRTAVEQQFIEAARLHRTAIGDISDSAEKLGRTTDNLRTGSDELHGAIAAHSSSFQELGRALTHSLEIDLVPTHQKLRAAVNSFDTCVGEFTACMRALRSTTESLSGNIEAATSDIGSLAGQLQPSVAAFREAVDDQFTAAAGQHEKNLRTLATSLEQMRQMGESLAKGATSVEQLLERHAGLSEQIEPVHEALLVAMDKIAVTGDTLKESLDTRVVPSHQTLGSAAESLAASAQRLGAFVEEGLDPATQRLVQLNQTLTQLEGTIDAIRDFSGQQDQIRQLSESLSKAAAVSEAIAELPERIRQVLAELVATHQDQLAHERGNWFGWLRTRSATLGDREDHSETETQAQ